jgi:hypothetical protein
MALYRTYRQADIYQRPCTNKTLTICLIWIIFRSERYRRSDQERLSKCEGTDADAGKYGREERPAIAAYAGSKKGVAVLLIVWPLVVSDVT